MLTRTALVLALAVSFAGCTMWEKPKSGWTGATGGEKLEQLFWDDVKSKNFASVDAHIASSFAGTGPSSDRSAFLQNLHAYQLTSVSLSECTSQSNGADLMITCKVDREGTPAARVSTLSVWQQYKKGWLMVAHAETPIEAGK